MAAVAVQTKPLLLDDAGVMTVFSISAGELQRWIDEGIMGREPLTVHGRRYWRVKELWRWIRACRPDRETWRRIEAHRASRGTGQ